jgi:hypothetical protein
LFELLASICDLLWFGYGEEGSDLWLQIVEAIVGESLP